MQPRRLRNVTEADRSFPGVPGSGLVPWSGQLDELEVVGRPVVLGAVVLVTHDPGAVEALSPDKVIVLPDGTEDLWSADYLDLVQLA